MPAIPKPGPALFLGIELATDQLRASIVDESLELVGVECIDFDTQLPEYKYVLLSYVLNVLPYTLLPPWFFFVRKGCLFIFSPTLSFQIGRAHV